MKLIVEGYELTGFVDGMLASLLRFISDREGNLICNSDHSFFQQQDKLLASWLLSTISSHLLACSTGVQSSCDVWSTANRLFTVITGSKLSRVKHDLHSIKKGTLSIKSM